MALFLTAGIPAFLVLVVNLFFSGSFDGRSALGWAAKGILWFFPGILVYGALAGLVPAAFSGWALYLSRTLLDLGFPLALGLAACLVSHRKDLIIPGETQFVRTVSFLSGFFLLFAIYTAVTYPAWYAGYLYFLLPLTWMSLITAAGLAFGAFFTLVTGLRFFFLAGAAAAVLFAGLVPLLYVQNHRLAAWFLALLFFAGSLLVVPRASVFLK